MVRQRTTDFSRATLNVKESSPVAVCFRSARCQQTINLIQGRLEMPGKSKVFLEPLILREDLEND